MASQRNFVSEPQCRSRQRGRHRLAALEGRRIHACALDLSQQNVNPHDLIENAASRIAAPAFFHTGEQIQVHSGGKILFAARDYDALHVFVSQRLVEIALKLRKAVLRHHVHAGIVDVPCDRGDSFVVRGIMEICHGSYLTRVL